MFLQEVKGNKPSWNRWLLQLQRRKSVPIVTAAVLIVLIVWVAASRRSDDIISHQAPEEGGAADARAAVPPKAVTRKKTKPTETVPPTHAADHEDARAQARAEEEREREVVRQKERDKEKEDAQKKEGSPSVLPAPSVTAGLKGGKYPLLTGLERDEEKLDAVRKELQFSWQMYKKHAWGSDILMPLSKRGRQWMGQGCTIIDALDTLYIAGLKEEYDEGIRWVERDLNFELFRDQLPLFETVIRVLGGLLGAYTLDPRPKVLEKARDIGDKLFYGVSASPSHFPHPTARWKTKGGSGPQIVLAEVGTIQLEYVALSAFTGDMHYAEGALRPFRYFHSTGHGIFGENCQVKGGTCSGKFSVGGGSDSVYEYFAKLDLMAGRKVPKIGDLWPRTVKDLKPLTAVAPKTGLTYIGDSHNGRTPQAVWGHLHCFIGGTYALMAKYAPTQEQRDEEFHLGEELGRTCREMYVRSTTKLGPSGIRFAGNDGYVVSGNDYVLRPEAIESWFYLYRHTKDPKYREWAWEAFLAIREECRVGDGYAGLHDVNRKQSYVDTMETFLLGETFKYLYCIFSDENDCDLRKYVFNTEAHPLPIFDPEVEPKYAELYKLME